MLDQILLHCFAPKCVQTYHSDEYWNDFSKPDCAWGLDDSDVDEHVRQVDDDQGPQESQPMPGTV